VSKRQPIQCRAGLEASSGGVKTHTIINGGENSPSSTQKQHQSTPLQVRYGPAMGSEKGPLAGNGEGRARRKEKSTTTVFLRKGTIREEKIGSCMGGRRGEGKKVQRKGSSRRWENRGPVGRTIQGGAQYRKRPRGESAVWGGPYSWRGPQVDGIGAGSNLKQVLPQVNHSNPRAGAGRGRHRY